MIQEMEGQEEEISSLDDLNFKYFDTLEELMRTKDCLCLHMKKGFNCFSCIRRTSADDEATKIKLPSDCEIKPFLTTVEFKYILFLL